MISRQVVTATSGAWGSRPARIFPVFQSPTAVILEQLPGLSECRLGMTISHSRDKQHDILVGRVGERPNRRIAEPDHQDALMFRAVLVPQRPVQRHGQPPG